MRVVGSNGAGDTLRCSLHTCNIAATDCNIVGEGRAEGGEGGEEARHAGTGCGADLADRFVQPVMVLDLSRGCCPPRVERNRSGHIGRG